MKTARHKPHAAPIERNPRPSTPRTGSPRKSTPACRASFASDPYSEPTNKSSAPSRRNCSATASAGKIWPPVPPVVRMIRLPISVSCHRAVREK